MDRTALASGALPEAEGRLGRVTRCLRPSPLSFNQGRRIHELSNLINQLVWPGEHRFQLTRTGCQILYRREDGKLLTTHMLKLRSAIYAKYKGVRIANNHVSYERNDGAVHQELSGLPL